jgi:oxygen-independent coproporphyrinogen-3 oxidase
MPLFSLFPLPIVPNNIPLTLYVHIPWCVKKCPYCDFNSYEKNSFFDEQAYVNALLADLESEYKYHQYRTLNSIFIGGGTPSLFSADSIFRIIEGARQLFRFNNIETTLEANPGTFEQEKFNQYREAGVNRLSIGIQSFNDKHLKSLGRIHDTQRARAAIETAINAGFDNINLDLMFGLPQQTKEQALNDIHIAMEYNVSHISLYQLTIEENTYFYKHRPALPENDSLWEIQTLCQQVLAEHDYHQYEISAWSKTGKQCVHNMNYWQFGDYMGIGAGAHGKRSEPGNDSATGNGLSIYRQWKYRQPREYIKQALSGKATAGSRTLKQRDIIFEFLLNALRLKTGCAMDTFDNHTGLGLQDLTAATETIDPGLLVINDHQIVTTEKGYLFLNDILEQLV